jgi:hypothetical protein
MGNFNTRVRFQDRDVKQLSGDTIVLSGTTIIDGTFKYTPGAVAGYVLTSDASGVASWQMSPSGSGVFTGNTSASCITDLYITNLHGCSPITIYNSLQSNGSLATGTLSHAEGSQTTASGIYSHTEGILTKALGIGSHSEGGGNLASGTYSHAEGQSNTASGYYSHAGGYGSNSFGAASFVHSFDSSIIGNNSAILGGQNITGLTNNTTYVPNLTVRENFILHSDSVLEVVDIPGSFENLAKGSYTEFNWDGITTNLLSNSNPSGYTSFILGNLSTFPTNNNYGFLSYYGSGYTRTGVPQTGSDFYRDKLVLKGASGSNGLIINPKGGDQNASIWFEVGGSSVIKIKGDGVSGAYMGLAMDPNGVEDATASLQIGGTGTTGTFVYKPSNIPSSSGDTIGNVGEFSWDNNYFYLKTNLGWGRVALDYLF